MPATFSHEFDLDGLPVEVRLPSECLAVENGSFRREIKWRASVDHVLEGGF